MIQFLLLILNYFRYEITVKSRDAFVLFPLSTTRTLIGQSIAFSPGYATTAEVFPGLVSIVY